MRPKTHEERKAKDLIDSVVKEYLESNQIYLTEIKPFGDFQFGIVFDQSGPEPRGEIAAPMYFVACVYKYQRDMYLVEGRHKPHFIIPIEEEGSVQPIGKSVSMLNRIFEEDDARRLIANCIGPMLRQTQWVNEKRYDRDNVRRN